jgi:acetylornithine/N-succinyldiaminopimelate aminotransferase
VSNILNGNSRLFFLEEVFDLASSKLTKIIEDDSKFLYQNYGKRQEVCFVKGKGSLLYDQDGKEYIDLFSGIAVSNLGHSHPAINAALAKQSKMILHSSNHYYNNEQIEVAKLISELAFSGNTLFLNTGTEANEAAIKLVRKYGLEHSKKKIEILSFHNSFHGRTFGSMTETRKKKIHEGFGPLPQGFEYLPYNDIKAFKKAANKDKTAAIIIELIQGEGGVIQAQKAFIKELFDICQNYNILTVVDEVQTGVGRTGLPFAFQHYGITPDIITLAKGLAGGLPLGAMHTKKFLLPYFSKGVHGTTFGGNHLSCALSLAVLSELKKLNFFKEVNKISKYIFERLNNIKSKTNIIQDIRGLGLLIGIEINSDAPAIVKKALERGLVINCTSEKVLRLAPALTIKMKEIETGMDMLENILLGEK